MATKLTISSILGASFTACVVLAQNRLRKIDGGMFSGVPRQDPNVLVVEDIPFGAPPAGELRWRALQPVKPWPGVKVASEVGPARVGRKSGSIPPGGMIEDRLYLNMWSPTYDSGAALPCSYGFTMADSKVVCDYAGV